MPEPSRPLWKPRPLSQNLWVRSTIIAFLALLLQIPIGMLFGLISERSQRQQEVQQEIAASWGGEQVLSGNWLTIPYSLNETIETVTTEGKKKKRESYVKTSHAYLMVFPQDFSIEGKLSTQLRSRGIFNVPVYNSNLNIHSNFSSQSIRDALLEKQKQCSNCTIEAHWDQSYFSFGLSDPRSLQLTATLEGKDLKFESGGGVLEKDGRFSGVHSPLPNFEPISLEEEKDGQGEVEEKLLSLNLKLSLRGSKDINFVPVGQSNKVSLESDWAHPSFYGSELPETRTITDEGFKADWKLLALGHALPDTLILSEYEGQPHAAAFGVELKPALDHYLAVERSVKYAFLFFVFIFGVVWLFEFRSKLTVHPLHYLMFGAAICVFYLLELALAEHLPFSTAYGIGSSMFIVLTTTYARSVLRLHRRAAVLALGSSSVLSLFYILLRNEDYSLLLGSMSLFFMLAISMFCVRNTSLEGQSLDSEV